MKILVTGGAGFIGSHFTELCIENKADVHIVDALTYASHKTIIENLEGISFTRGDINDIKFCSEILESYNPDFIVNFAAETHVDNSIKDALPFIYSNIAGVHNLLKLLPNNCRFVQISTDEVYGDIKNKPPSDEDTAYSPQNPYAATKAAADHLIHSWVNTYNIDAVLARSCNVFGPRQNIEKFIPKVILQISKQLPITLYDDGLNIRQWIHVKDCCMAIFKIMKYGRRGESYNIGTMNCLRNIDMLENLMFLTKRWSNEGDLNLTIKKVKARPGHDFRYELNYQKIINELNWTPDPDFAKQLEDTIAYYVDS